MIQKPCDSSKASQQWSISNPDAELVRLGAEHPLPDNFVQNACAQAPEGEEWPYEYEPYKGSADGPSGKGLAPWGTTVAPLSTPLLLDTKPSVWGTPPTPQLSRANPCSLLLGNILCTITA